MSKYLFEKILEIGTNEYLENDLIVRSVPEDSIFLRQCVKICSSHDGFRMSHDRCKNYFLDLSLFYCIYEYQ